MDEAQYYREMAHAYLACLKLARDHIEKPGTWEDKANLLETLDRAIAMGKDY